ncbi:MAG: response regulator [Syntrophobacteraceae bacterium]
MSDFSLLLVDDEQEFVKALAERLEMRGFRARFALNGERALKMIQDEVPDLVILDLNMPGMDGMEVLRHIKRDSPQVQVIILTAHGSQKDRELGLQLGAFEQLQKPVQIEDLVRTMKEAYEERTCKEAS